MASVRRVAGIGTMLLGIAALAAAVSTSTAAVSHAQSAPPAEPLVVVESFLLARNSGDPLGASGWCTTLLELQDIDAQWFVDEPTHSYWLRQLTDKYLVETLSPPVAAGNVVTWTDRLSPRKLQLSDPWSRVMRVEVSAVIQDGKIAS